MFHQDDNAADNQQSQPQEGSDWQHPGVPLDNGAQPQDQAQSDWQQPAADDNGGADSRSVEVTSYQAGHDAGAAGSGEPSLGGNLTSIKKQALSQLTPIMKSLDQTPEDRFRTLMMMIQSNDNQDLIKDAYAAAGEIQDEKAKAQALLDVVNEIDYFNSQSK